MTAVKITRRRSSGTRQAFVSQENIYLSLFSALARRERVRGDSFFGGLGSRSRVTVPPAASIFSRAVAETACATTVRLVLRSPLPRIFTSFRVLRTRPTSLSSSGVTSVPASKRSREGTLTGCEYGRKGPVGLSACGG